MNRKVKLAILTGRPTPPRIVKKVIPAVPLMEDGRKKREFWYSDSYLLSDGVKALIASTPAPNVAEELKSLLDRHQATANAEVFGVAMQLVSKTKKYQLVVDLYEMLKKKKLKPSSASYTTILHSVSKLKKPDLATDIFDKIEERDLKHVNTILRVSTPRDARKIWDSLKILEPDSQTYTAMMTACTQDQRDTFMPTLFKEAEDKGLVDGILVATYIKYLKTRQIDKFAQESRRNAIERNTLIMELIERYYGLPSSHKEFLSKYRFPVSNQTLTTLLYLVSDYPALGQNWYETCVKRFKLVPDDTLLNALANVYLQSNQFERAWTTSSDPTFQIRICHNAIHAAEPRKEGDVSDVRELWATRAEECYGSINGDINIRTLFDLLSLCILTKSAITPKLLEKYKSQLTDETRNLVEIAIDKNLNPNSELRLRISALKLIEGSVYGLYKQRVNDIMALTKRLRKAKEKTAVMKKVIKMKSTLDPQE